VLNVVIELEQNHTIRKKKVRLRELNRDEWVNIYNNDKTKRQAKIALKAFDKFLEANLMQENVLFNEMKKRDNQDRYIMLQKIIIFWKAQRISPATIKNYWNFLKNWWWHNGILMNQESIRAYVKFPRIMKEMKEPLTKEIIRKLVNASEQPYKTLWLVLASSGMRIEEATLFTEKNIQWGSDQHPTRILLGPEITKYSLGRETYISSEASMMLKRNMDLYQTLTPAKADTYMAKLRRELKLLDKYSNGKNYHVQVHAFKSFFMTAAIMIHGEKYSNAMGGHERYLPEYNRIPKLIRENMYLKVEPDVTIQDQITTTE
jgi:integrase